MPGRKKGSKRLTPLELKIMQVLWREGPSNVQLVQQNLLPADELAYNTVQTMLNVLHRKGRVRRALKGRAYIYRAVASRETVLGQAVRDLIDRMFGGSSEELLMSLIKSRQVDAKKIAELGRRLASEERSASDERR
jgi:predicted transcriptional regulator